MKIPTHSFRLPAAVLALVTCLLPGAPAQAAEPVSITAIDARTGIVSARDMSHKRTIRFKVTDRALLRSLKVGQQVSVNLDTQKVSVDGAEPCCSVVAVRVDKAEPVGAVNP